MYLEHLQLFSPRHISMFMPCRDDCNDAGVAAAAAALLSLLRSHSDGWAATSIPHIRCYAGLCEVRARAKKTFFLNNLICAWCSVKSHTMPCNNSPSHMHNDTGFFRTIKGTQGSQTSMILNGVRDHWVHYWVWSILILIWFKFLRTTNSTKIAIGLYRSGTNEQVSDTD